MRLSAASDSCSSLIGLITAIRLAAFGQDDFLARADGLDGFREVLVGFAQSELHVVMLLHFLPPALPWLTIG